MASLIIVLLIVSLMIWFVAVQRSGKKQKGQSEPAVQERNLFNLVVGDIVQYDLRDWVVESIYAYEQGQYGWTEYLMRDASDVAWLCVEEDDWLELSWMVPVPSEDVALQLPLKNNIPFNGVTYALDEKGTATFSTQGRARVQSGTCQFYDYKTRDGKLLSIESYGMSLEQGGDVELCVGQSIQPADLTLLPGDGRSVYTS